MIKNPYLEEAEPYLSKFFDYETRREFVFKYSWAIPNKEAIKYLIGISPIVEIGAGTGYWAYLIRRAGGDIVAYDTEPYYNEQANNKWSEVLVGDIDSVVNYKDRTLFLGWPLYNESMAYDCLSLYEGNKLIYIGERQGGCNANDEFFNLLSKEWELVKEIDIPTWNCIYDSLYSYERKV